MFFRFLTFGHGDEDPLKLIPVLIDNEITHRVAFLMRLLIIEPQLQGNFALSYGLLISGADFIAGDEPPQLHFDIEVLLLDACEGSGLLNRIEELHVKSVYVLGNADYFILHLLVIVGDIPDGAAADREQKDQQRRWRNNKYPQP